MATVIKEISLPHGTIPTQMFGNVNLQNAMMYVNENFAEVKSGVNDAVAAANEALDAKADADHDHDEDYAALSHTHAQSEIVGLSSALDGKADLNHEHSQYLTSLPAHYHATSEVQGLDNLLQAKAEKTHTHTIADVESLTTELGVKASTSYVDQQVSSVSTSIRTIAKDEVENHAADKGDSSTLSADVPKDVIEKPDSETIAAKNARVGTSTDYARADHVHVFDFEMPEVPSVGTLTNDHILKATITTESGKTVKKIDDSGIYSPAALALSASDSVMVYQSGTQITSGNLVKADSSAYKVVDSEIKASDVSATVGLFDKENETPTTIKKTALPKYALSSWMKTDASGNIGTTSESPVTLPGTVGVLATDNGSTCVTKSIGRAEGNVCPGVHTHDPTDIDGLGSAALCETSAFAVAATEDIADSALSTAKNAYNLAESKPDLGNTSTTAAYGNHGHGNITNAGTITGGANCIVCTDGNGSIHANGQMSKDVIECVSDAVKSYDNSAATGKVRQLVLCDSANSTGIDLDATTSTSTIRLGYASSIQSTIVGNTNGNLSLSGANDTTIGKTDKNLTLNGAANATTLANAPTVDTTATTSKAVATCGWTASNFMPASGLGKSKWMKTDADGKPSTTDDSPIVASPSSTGVVYNTAGTISYKTIGTATGNVAAGDHTHAYGSASLTGFGTAAASDASDFASKATETTASTALENAATAQATANSKIDKSTADGLYQPKADALTAITSGGNYNTSAQHHIAGGAHYVSAAPSSDIVIGVRQNQTSIAEMSTLNSSMIMDDSCTSGGDCLAYFKSDKTLGHLSYATNTATVSNTNAVTADFDYDTSGSTKTAVLNYKAAGANAAPTEKKAIGFAANSSSASLIDVATVSSKPQSGSSIASVNSDGEISDECEILTTAPSTDKVLTVKKNNTAISWEDVPAPSPTMDNNPVNNELYPSDAEDPYPSDLGFTDWDAGNVNDRGLKLSAYVMLSDYDGSRLMMPIVISITKDGIVSSVKKSTSDKCLTVSF